MVGFVGVWIDIFYKWPCGLMDKTPASGAGDCRIESCQGRRSFYISLPPYTMLPSIIVCVCHCTSTVNKWNMKMYALQYMYCPICSFEQTIWPYWLSTCVGGRWSRDTQEHLSFELWFFSNCSEKQPSGWFCLDSDWHLLLWISDHRHAIITVRSGRVFFFGRWWSPTAWMNFL